jgi:protein ImuB
METVICALIRRFQLLAAVGGRQAELAGPVAIAPEPGGVQSIGECSGAAEAYGVRAGMALSEALARCPSLHLVPGDPARAGDRWEQVLRSLEEIGAEVEPGAPGEARFRADGLKRLYGGETATVIARARRALPGSVRFGAGPSRFCAFAAAQTARARRPAPVIRAERTAAFLAPLPISLLRNHLDDPGRRSLDNGPEQDRFLATLERLGISSLGELAGLPRAAVADRLGQLGMRARELALGADTPLRPRRPHTPIVRTLQIPESAAARQLSHALGLLIARLLAAPELRGRTVRRLRLEAQLTTGGSWQTDVVLRSATASAELIALAAEPRLGEIPGPVSGLALRVMEMAPASGLTTSIEADPGIERRRRLGEAVSQARAACGRDAVLQIIDVEPGSHVPERRTLLSPFPETLE